MNIFKFSTTLFCIACLSGKSQDVPASWQNTDDFLTYNRTIEQVIENEKSIIRFNESKGHGIAWMKNMEFSEGTIEFDLKGRDILQKSFIGIAFHGQDNDRYETVYFRPFNFQSADPVRKIHAVQYAYEPQFGFEELRRNRKDEFESAIEPASVRASDWFHVKLEVKSGRIKVFVNDSESPCLNVETLNPSQAGTKVGYWVGNNSDGDFAHIKVSK